MRENNQSPVYIFALNFPGQDPAPRERLVLEGIVDTKYTPCTGSWEGVEEDSYIITADVWHRHSERLTELLKDNDQDAVLFLDNQRNAFLVFQTEDGYNQRVYQGEFKQVPEAVAKRQKAWTRVGSVYYIVREV